MESLGARYTRQQVQDGYDFFLLRKELCRRIAKGSDITREVLCGWTSAYAAHAYGFRRVPGALKRFGKRSQIICRVPGTTKDQDGRFLGQFFSIRIDRGPA
jgi:hypothetical protein